MITTLESQQSSAAELINFSDQIGAALNPYPIVIQSEFTFCFSFRLHFVNIRGIFHTPDAAPWAHAPQKHLMRKMLRESVLKNTLHYQTRPRCNKNKKISIQQEEKMLSDVDKMQLKTVKLKENKKL